MDEQGDPAATERRARALQVMLEVLTDSKATLRRFRESIEEISCEPEALRVAEAQAAMTEAYEILSKARLKAVQGMTLSEATQIAVSVLHGLLAQTRELGIRLL